jgi:hypothetical protein
MSSWVETGLDLMKKSSNREQHWTLIAENLYRVVLQAGGARSSSDIAQLSAGSGVVDGELAPDHAHHRSRGWRVTLKAIL